MSAVLEIRRMRARRQKKRSGLPWWLMVLFALGALGAVGAAVGLGGAYAYYQSYAKDYVPIEEKLQQSSRGLTEIYDRGGPENGVLLGKLQAPPEVQLLEPVLLEDISGWLIQATISTEDNSFEDNPGVNIRGLVRAAYERYVQNEIEGGSGGSSITQQLIKNVYICPSISEDVVRCTSAERTLDRKMREIVYAIELNRDYTKDQILEWYLNQISYAGQYVGVQSAARGYFQKDAADLTLAEAALLAGIPQSPTLYHPRQNCVADAEGVCIFDEFGRTTVGGAAKERQESVIDLMVEHGRATPEQGAAAKAEEVKVYPSVNDVKAAAWIDNQVEPVLVRMCEAGVLPRAEGTASCKESVHSAGFRVTTTLDWDLTSQATQMINDFVARGLENGCECYNGAIVTIEPSTGQVIVYAANRDPNNVGDPRIAGQIDQLNEINQPGSSFKPAVYLTYFDTLNKHPMSVFWDTSPLPIEGTQFNIVNPRNDGKTGEGLITARAGLGGSQNVPAFRAAVESGTDNVIEMAKKLGITTLHQGFDPTFRAHADVTYGSTIATGGANIRAIDMAYMDATIANMGTMVGLPHLATYVDPKTFKSTAIDTGDNYDLAIEQRVKFAQGHIRLPGTRELDPVTILEVRDKDGTVIYRAPEPERRQVVDAGSVWLLHSIMSDCTARFIIWGCGGSNNDLSLDSFLADGTKIPTGIKTGTQQGARDINATLETWMTGYSRYAGTAIWIGNANNEEVRDGTRYGFASANTTVRLFKNWMGRYHDVIQSRGVFSTPAGFENIQPKNVAQRSMSSPNSERGRTASCDNFVSAWVRTDVRYDDPCTTYTLDSRNGNLASNDTPQEFRVARRFPRLPSYKPDLAIKLAGTLGIGIAPTTSSDGKPLVVIGFPGNGAIVGGDIAISGSAPAGAWRVELGSGANPSDFRQIAAGTSPVQNGLLGTLSIKDLADGVYTLRLTGKNANGQDVTASSTFNVKKGATPVASGTPSGSPSPSTTAGPSQTPTTPVPTQQPPPTVTPTPPPGLTPTPTP